MNTKPTQLLFITWDSDRTSYLESLFLPILSGLQERGNYRCQVLQFSWAPKEKVREIKVLSTKLDIVYTHFRIARYPHPALGTYLTVLRGTRFLKKYLETQPVDMVMPRSTMPAWMLNRLKPWLRKWKFKTVFDADGLPLEERLDFAGLKKSDFQYKLLKKQETLQLQTANRVLTRSQKAIEFHLGNLGDAYRNKFYKVSNGRNANGMAFQEGLREKIRKSLGLEEETTLWVYQGSLGPQYAWEEMWAIFTAFYQKNPNSMFLILSPQLEFVKGKISANWQEHVICKSVAAKDVPSYLAAADRAFCLRKPKPSMQGIAPIKLGDYLMMGLPTIVSRGIGDVEDLLDGLDFVHILDHNDAGFVDKALCWSKKGFQMEKEGIRDFAMEHFSLEKSIADYLRALEGF
ncbi:hypothetical protein QWY93_00730 [Echinicola jeungdonensis]|uniref:Uncharacterized protein n=1 Tax=Echinicola jeungdonensis TaxID=709343 RepID=A0ABV5J4A2_9BACT|nr:hypothetical protein [Echinicola jeungdonensis]MDN3667864.1 hypothetical protein [Echinicola jeungdonensis]